VEAAAIGPLQNGGEGSRGTIASMFKPMAHLLNGMASHGGFALIGQAFQLGCMEAGAAAEGFKQRGQVLLRFVAAGEGAKHLTQAHSKQGVHLKLLLMAEQVQLHKQLVGRSPIERRNYKWEGGVKGALAVSNGLMLSQRWHGKKMPTTLASLMAPLRSEDLTLEQHDPDRDRGIGPGRKGL
jgi:hypothetical protein